jgi:hypothetical protein
MFPGQSLDYRPPTGPTHAEGYNSAPFHLEVEQEWAADIDRPRLVASGHFTGPGPAFPETDSITVNTASVSYFLFGYEAGYEGLHFTASGEWHGRLSEGGADTTLTGTIDGDIPERTRPAVGTFKVNRRGETILSFVWDARKDGPGGGGG